MNLNGDAAVGGKNGGMGSAVSNVALTVTQR